MQAAGDTLVNKRRLSFALALVLVSSGGAFGQSIDYGPFKDVPLSGLTANHRKIIVEASEDFEAVKAGRQPVHAVRDAESPLPADGGTSFWIGVGYRLSISKSLSSFGELDGYIYGPRVQFDEVFAPGNSSVVSETRFYTGDQMKALLKPTSAKKAP